MVKKIVKTFFKLISKNPILGFRRRLVFYIKTIETIYIDIYLVYRGDLMIDDLENKDFAKIKFCESENKLFDARFVKMNEKVTRKLQTFLCIKFVCKKPFLFSFFQFWRCFSKKGKNVK